MRALQHLFANNRLWAERIKAQDPEFFGKLTKQQRPDYLWIGCSDSRVPANQIIGLLPGEVFVHRNVANVVAHSDLNCLSAVQFAVDVLQVRHVIVCGHYECGGVIATLRGQRFGLVDNWLRYVQDVRVKHASMLDEISDEASRARRLCELNVIEQVGNLCQTSIASDAWERGQPLSVHGWIYGVGDGLLRDLKIQVDNSAALIPAYETALEGLGRDGLSDGGDHQAH